jgi:hypothetical protein
MSPAGSLCRGFCSAAFETALETEPRLASGNSLPHRQYGISAFFRRNPAI